VYAVEAGSTVRPVKTGGTWAGPLTSPEPEKWTVSAPAESEAPSRPAAREQRATAAKEGEDRTRAMRTSEQVPAAFGRALAGGAQTASRRPRKHGSADGGRCRARRSCPSPIRQRATTNRTPCRSR